jgi:metallo-beta-lactamase family protein
LKIQFLGATGTVTGSRYLITKGSTRILVDCGLFQGFKNLRLKNWEPFLVPPSEISAVLLTHAHLDHSGYIPLLVKNGFAGPVYCTRATSDLCGILLPDSGFLQEEEADFANRRHYSKHKPALALYTEKEARVSLQNLKPIDWKTRYSIGQNNERFDFEFHPAGHLLGAATILIYSEDKSIALSGDLGRTSDPLVRSPDFTIGADFLVVESTYGNRKHSSIDPQSELCKIILKTYQRGGTLVIPSFAVGRAQLVLHYIRQLKLSHSIPDIPVFLNSPMAIHANSIFRLDSTETKVSKAEAEAICATAQAVSSIEESVALNNRKDPIIIIAASGMATGGRVLYHLKAFGPDPKNTILFVGFQAGGTRGEAMIHGTKEIKIHGEFWPIRAEVAQLDSMSAHADADEILEWIKNLKQKPKHVFVTHGEPAAADSLRRRIEQGLAMNASVPDFQQIVDLDKP